MIDMNKKMIAIVSTVVIIAAAVVALTLSTPKTHAMGNKPQTDEYAAPAFSGMDIQGKGKINIRNYKGKVVLINFWATWCPPCRKEIPDIIKFREEHKGKFEVIGISVDRDGIDGVRHFVKNIGITYPVIMGTPELIRSYGGIQAIPTSFLVDKDGDLVKKIVGFRNYTQFTEMITPFLED